MTKDAWWRQYHDPTLNRLVTTALHTNNKLQVSIGNILYAQAEISKADYGWLPTASVGGGGLISQTFDTNVNSSIPGLSGNQNLNNSGSLVGIMPSYTINIVRQYKLGEIARLSDKMQVNAKNAARISIISQVTGAYFSLLAAQQQVILQNEMITKFEIIYKSAALQYKQGSSSKLYPELIKQQLASQRGKLAKVEKDVVHFQNALQVLLGRNPGTIIGSRTINDIDTSVSVPVNLPSKVLENRPDIAMAEHKLETANANIGLARSQFFPSIDLTGTFGNATLALGQLASMNAWAWAGTAVAAVPIFNLSILADTNKAKAQFYQGYYNYINTLQKAFQEVDDNLAERTAESKNLSKQIVSLQSTQTQRDILYMNYTAGAISKSDLTSIYINVINQKMQVNQSKLKKLMSVTNLYQSLGAGYNIDNYKDANYKNPVFDK